MRIVYSIVLTLVCLLFARVVYPNDAWAIGLLVFLFVAVPLFLVGLRDVLAPLLSRWVSPKQLLLHVFAAFALLVGLLVLVSQSGSTQRSSFESLLLLLVFPAIVYLMPLFAVLKGVPFEEARSYYRRKK